MNSKLAYRVEPDITPERIDSDPPQDYEDLTRPSPLGPDTPHTLSHSTFCGLDRTLEPSKEPFAGMNDRCCICSTPASKDEFMTRLCCNRVVGSICFEETLLEDRKCCLCQAHPYKSDVQYLDALLDGAFVYKFHFIPTTSRDDSDNKAEVETARTACLEETKGFSTGSLVADDQPRLSDDSKPPIADATKKQRDPGSKAFHRYGETEHGG